MFSLDRLKYPLSYKDIVVIGGEKQHGCIAKEFIAKETIIEVCPILTFKNTDIKDNVCLDSRFILNEKEFAIPLGNGCSYNHSENNNADYYFEGAYMLVKALRDIGEGEQILINYGETYDYKRNFKNYKL